jgi:hypothetical protein
MPMHRRLITERRKRKGSNMTKLELATAILDETEGRTLSEDESPNDIIRDAAICRQCGEDVIREDELNKIVAETTDIDHWGDLLSQALQAHPCS